MNFSAADHQHMARALRLAARGLNTTTPNPRVGCVIVRDGAVVGEGWHERAGAPHAEILALAAVSGSAAGCTAYVTLEPCSHHGRTPPCAEALIGAGIGRVVAAMQDPNPQVSGRGLAKLSAAGIRTDCGLLESQARELNCGFVSRMVRGRPWVRLKVAASLDGKTALVNGCSQWLTGGDARRDVHRWRARACAVLTGSGTVRYDNPRLTVREVPCRRQPLPVVVDSRLQLAETAAIFAMGPVVVAAAADPDGRADRLRAAGAEVLFLPDAAGRVDLPQLLIELARRGVNELLVEAGARLNGALLASRCVDEVLLYLAPTIIGDAARGLFALPELSDLADQRRLHVLESRMVGRDLRLRLRPE